MNTDNTNNNNIAKNTFTNLLFLLPFQTIRKANNEIQKDAKNKIKPLTPIPYLF